MAVSYTHLDVYKRQIQHSSTYDNRFIIHNIQLRFDKKIRNHMLEYATNIAERTSMRYSLTYKSVTILKDLLKNVLESTKTTMDDGSSISDEDLISNVEFIEEFEELIREVPDANFDAVDNYLIRLISPQVQIRSPCEPNTTVILAARDIEVGIIDIVQVMNKEGRKIALDVDTVVETRYCAVSKDIQLFTLFKDDLIKSPIKGLHRNGYGTDRFSEFWPPWIPLEMCFDGTLLAKHVFLKRRSMFCTFIAPNPLYVGDKKLKNISIDSKIRVGFPALILTSTSQQYCLSLIHI